MKLTLTDLKKVKNLSEVNYGRKISDYLIGGYLIAMDAIDKYGDYHFFILSVQYKEIEES